MLLNYKYVGRYMDRWSIDRYKHTYIDNREGYHAVGTRNSQHNIRHNMDAQIITAHGKIINAQKVVYGNNVDW